MEKIYHEVINHIGALTDTGLEAVEHLVSLKGKSVEISFTFALEILEMLSEVQRAFVDLQGLSWSREATEALEAVIIVFSQLADAYEAGDVEAYLAVIDEIHTRYKAFYAGFNKTQFQA